MKEQIEPLDKSPPRHARLWSDLWPFVVAVAIALAVIAVAFPSIPVIDKTTPYGGPSP
jgi:hypothetical protein